MKSFLKKVLLINSLLFGIFMMQSCLEEMLVGIHNLKIVNKTIYDLKDIKVTSVLQNGKSEVTFDEVKAEAESDFSKINDVLAGNYQVGFVASSGSKSEIYEKANLLSNPLLEFKVDKGKWNHTLTFTSSSDIQGITYKLTTEKKE